METIQIKDKRFKTFIPEANILKEVARVANEINRDLEGEKPLFLSVLNGSFMFTADLMKHLTMQRLLETLKARHPKEIRIATLLVKPDKLKVDLDIHYVAMRIPNDFIVGYGLDYDGLGRNYRDIYTVIE